MLINETWKWCQGQTDNCAGHTFIRKDLLLIQCSILETDLGQGHMYPIWRKTLHNDFMSSIHVVVLLLISGKKSVDKII